MRGAAVLAGLRNLHSRRLCGARRAIRLTVGARRSAALAAVAKSVATVGPILAIRALKAITPFRAITTTGPRSVRSPRLCEAALPVATLASVVPIIAVRALVALRVSRRARPIVGSLWTRQ